jgi:hypothetical protein
VLDVSALLRFLVGGGDDGCGDDAFDGAFDGGGELEILKVSLLLEKSNVSPSWSILNYRFENTRTVRVAEVKMLLH